MACFLCLQGSVKAYSFELEYCGSTTLHEIFDKLGSSHSDVEKTSDTLFPPNRTHVLSYKFFK